MCIRDSFRDDEQQQLLEHTVIFQEEEGDKEDGKDAHKDICLLYTSDAAEDHPCVDLGGRRHIKKKKKN